MSTWGDVTLVVNGEEPELSSGLLSIERAPPALRFPVLTVIPPKLPILQNSIHLKSIVAGMKNSSILIL